MNIKLLNVRLSFPSLYKAKSVNGSEPRYGASFLLNKKQDTAQIDALRKACLETAKEQWPNKIPTGVKYCVHDGSEKEFDGYGPDVIYISASATLQPPVVDENLQPLTAASGKPYAGCLVNVMLRLWAQDNQFGKRINAQIQAVQFAADGEAFGEKPVDPREVFTAAKPVEEGEPAFGILGKPNSNLPPADPGPTEPDDPGF